MSLHLQFYIWHLIYDTLFLLETQIHATSQYMTLYDFFPKEDKKAILELIKQMYC